MGKMKQLLMVLAIFMLMTPGQALAALSYSEAAIEAAMAKWAAFPKSTIMWWHASPKEGWCQTIGLMSTPYQISQASDVINGALLGMNQSWIEALSGKTVGLEGEMSSTAGYTAKMNADIQASKIKADNEARKYHDALGAYPVGHPCVSSFIPGTGIIASDAVSRQIDAMMSAEMMNFGRGLTVDSQGKSKPISTMEARILLAANAGKSEEKGSYFTEYAMFTEEQWDAWNAYRSLLQTPPPLARPNFADAASENSYKIFEATTTELRTIIDKPMRDFANDRRADIPFTSLRPWLGHSIPTPFAMPMTADADGAVSVKRQKMMTDAEIEEFTNKVNAEVEKELGRPMTGEEAAMAAAFTKQYLGTKYQLGARDPSQGVSDCSGTVSTLLRNVFPQAGTGDHVAADIIQKGAGASGGLFGGNDLKNLDADFFIIGSSSHTGNGRFNDIDHVVYVYRREDGSMWAAESAGGKAQKFIERPYDQWYQSQVNAGRDMYGFDPGSAYGGAPTSNLGGAPNGGAGAGGTSSENVEVEQTIYEQKTDLKISKNVLLRVIAERYVAEDFLTRLDILDERGILKEHMRLEGLTNLMMKEIREELRLRNLLDSIEGAKILKTMAADKEQVLRSSNMQ